MGIPLRDGSTVVEVRNRQEGWVERFEVHSDAGVLAIGGGQRSVVFDLAAFPQVDTDLQSTLRSQGGAQAAGAGSGSRFDRAVKLCEWLERKIELEPGSDQGSDDSVSPIPAGSAVAILFGKSSGIQKNCQVHADALQELLQTHGIVSRRITLATRLGSPYEGHAAVEIWDEGAERWIFLDPFFCMYYAVDGELASALDLHRAVSSQRVHSIEVFRVGKGIGADPWNFRISPLLYFRRIMLALPDGSLMVYWHAGAPIDIASNRAFVLVDSDAAFVASPGHPVSVPAPRAYRADRGIVAQIVDQRLYLGVLRDTFEPGTHEVRFSADLVPAFAPPDRSYDLENGLLCRPPELLANPFLVDDDFDNLPDGWNVSGTPTLLTRHNDGLIVEAGSATVRLEAPVRLSPGLPLVATSHLHVERGDAAFEFSGRRSEFVVHAREGAPVKLSPPIVNSRSPDGVAVTIAPYSRCRIISVHLRYGHKLTDHLRREVSSNSVQFIRQRADYDVISPGLGKWRVTNLYRIQALPVRSGSEKS